MKTTGRAVFDKLGFYLPPHHANASWHSAVVLGRVDGFDKHNAASKTGESREGCYGFVAA